MKTKSTFRLILFFVAVTITTFWIVLSGAYLARLGWNGILSLEPTSLSMILIALSSPPLIFWLILAFLTQQNEINSFREITLDLVNIMHRQFEQSEASVKIMLELSSSSRRQFVKDGLLLILNDLSSNVAIIGDRTGVLTGDSLDLAWAKYGAGDIWALMRPFIDRSSMEEGFDIQLKNAILSDRPSMVAAASFVRRADSIFADNIITTPEQKILFDLLQEGPLEKLKLLLMIELEDTEIDGDIVNNEINKEITADKLIDEEQVLEGFSSAQRVSSSQTNLFPDTAKN